MEDDEESPKVEDQIDSSTLPLIIKEALSPEEFTAQADKDAKEIQDKLDVLTLRVDQKCVQAKYSRADDHEKHADEVITTQRVLVNKVFATRHH